MDANYNRDFGILSERIGQHEKRLTSLENKLWVIILLLFTNLGGIIGILLRS